MAHRFRSSCVLLWLLFGLTLTKVVYAAEYEARIWADKSGKFEVRATYVDVIDGKVRLERPNGTISRVPLEKLSEADQKYVRDLVKQPPPKKPAMTEKTEKPSVQGLQVGDKVEAEDFRKWRPATVVEIDYEWERVRVEFDGEPGRGRRKSLKELRYPKTMQQPILVKPAAPGSALKTIRPDYTEMDRLLAEGTPADRVKADPMKPLGGAWKPRAVRLASASEIRERMSIAVLPADIAVCTSPTPIAMVVYEKLNPLTEGHALVELVDLVGRKVVLKGPAPEETGALSMSPAGRSVVTFRSKFGGSESTGVINFWKIADKKVNHWVSFAPYVMNKWPNLDSEWAAWLDDERLFTMNKEGQLILWQVEGAKAIYELMVDGAVQPILTHGSKYLVVPSSSGVQFFDSQSGELKAVVGSGDYRYANLAFSPSGKQLAVASEGFIDVLDVTTGTNTRSFPCENINSADAIAWVDEEYLFTNNGLVIHVPLRLIAWKYEIQSRLVKSFAGTHWALMEDILDKGQILTPLVLPPPEASGAIANLDEESLLIVRPGDAISIDVQIHDNNLLAQDVKRALSEAVAEAEMKVSDGSDLKLVAKAKTGETEKVRYTRFGVFNDPGETVEVVSRVYELELLRQGVVVWRRESIHSAPFHVQMQEGETIRGAIDREMKPRARNFRGRLPSYVLHPEYRKPLGKSKLSL